MPGHIERGSDALPRSGQSLPPGVVVAGRAFGALAFTAFIAWYAADFALTRGSTTVEFAAWMWIASLGWLVVVVGILGIRPDLGNRYHETSGAERSGRLYRILAVPLAARFMPNGEHAIRLVRILRPGYRVIAGRESARRWEATTRSKEASHVVHLALTVPLLGYLLANTAMAAVISLVVLDVAFDLYPVLAQRYNRSRIRAILDRETRQHAAPRDGVSGARATTHRVGHRRAL